MILMMAARYVLLMYMQFVAYYEMHSVIQMSSSVIIFVGSFRFVL